MYVYHEYDNEPFPSATTQIWILTPMERRGPSGLSTTYSTTRSLAGFCSSHAMLSGKSSSGPLCGPVLGPECVDTPFASL